MLKTRVTLGNGYRVSLNLIKRFLILTIDPFISKSLLGNTPVTMAVSKSALASIHHELAQYNFFWKIILFWCLFCLT